MKKRFFLSLVLGFGLLAWTGQAQASVCMTLFKAAAKKAAKDIKCQAAAAKTLAKFVKQVKICKRFRKMLKTCRRARRASRKSCRRSKRHDIRKCKRIKRGKRRRQCKRRARKEKRACQRAGRKTKRACRRKAKTTQAFKVCKDGRKMTRKAGLRLAGCVAKYFLPAAIGCAASMAVGGF